MDSDVLQIIAVVIILILCIIYVVRHMRRRGVDKCSGCELSSHCRLSQNKLECQNDRRNIDNKQTGVK